MRCIQNRWKIPIIAACLCLTACISKTQSDAAHHLPKDKPNILFIAIDDLRPQLNCYGESMMHTPHLDRLASQGRLFKRHYVQAPTCGASRHALLTGIRPNRKVHINNNVFKNLQEEGVELAKPFPQVLRENGYYTVGIGKIGHFPDGKMYTYDGQGEGKPEMPGSWDEMLGPFNKWGTAWNAFFGYADGSNRTSRNKEVPPFEQPAVADTAYPDGLIAMEAVQQLGALAKRKEPFLLAVGFLKPHLPFNAPKQYWDLYERDAIDIAPNPDAPENVNASSLHRSNELFGNYKQQAEKGGLGVRISDAYAREVRHAYYASVSFVDAQVGKVLNALKGNDLDKNTIIVVWGDHGWHLGEHTIWGKHTLFERSLRSAFMVKTPDMQQKGVSTDAIIETLDVYPTLMELTGIASPDGLGGKSFVGLLEDPNAKHTEGAYAYWRNGLSFRNDRYRLTAYQKGEPRFELYDHQVDPNETTNIAAEKPEVMQALTQQLKGHFQFEERD